MLPTEYFASTRQLANGHYLAVCRVGYRNGSTSDLYEPPVVDDTTTSEGRLPQYQTMEEALAKAVDLCGRYRRARRWQ